MVKLGVTYLGNRLLNHAREDLARIAESCHYVIHPVSETDLRFHQSVLSKMIQDSRKRGLEVWVDPWALGGVFGGEAISRFLLDHRDAWQVMSNGKTVPSACLNRPEWRSFVKEWVLTVRDMGAQVVFWDEPHIAFDFQSEIEGIYSCCCGVCRDLFRKKYGTIQPDQLNALAHQFRRDTIGDFLKEIMAFSKSKEMVNSICLYAFKGHEQYDKLWKEAAALNDLDIFGCDPYWRWRGRHNPTKYVGDFSKYVVETAFTYGKKPQVWVQAMRLPAGKEHEIEEACLAAVKEGVTHLAAWSFDGGETLDPVLSENPQAVWSAVEKTFKEIRKAAS